MQMLTALTSAVTILTIDKSELTGTQRKMSLTELALIPVPVCITYLGNLSGKAPPNQRRCSDIPRAPMGRFVVELSWLSLQLGMTMIAGSLAAAMEALSRLPSCHHPTALLCAGGNRRVLF